MRLLNDAEIRAIWHAADVIKYPYGPFYQLLCASGMRSGEWARAVG